MDTMIRAGQRQGGEVLWQTTGNYSTSSAPTVFRLKTSHVNSVTPNERLVLGGSLSLVDNTLTNLFSVTFAAADQKVVGGEIHMMIVAKQVTGISANAGLSPKNALCVWA